MGKIVSILNFKGGVGKTTATLHLATALWLCGKRVCVVDCDAQANATSRMKIRQFTKGSLTEWLATYKRSYPDNMPDVEDVPIPIYRRYDGLDIIPTKNTISMIYVLIENEYMLLNRHDIRDSNLCLQVRLESIRNDYDYILIDCPPSPGFMNDCILAATDQVIIPFLCSGEAEEGMSKMFVPISSIKSSTSPNLEVLGALAMEYRANLIITKKTFIRLNPHMHIFRTKIRENCKVKDSTDKYATIYEYYACETNTEGCKKTIDDFKHLVKEVFGEEVKPDWLDRLIDAIELSNSQSK